MNKQTNSQGAELTGSSTSFYFDGHKKLGSLRIDVTGNDLALVTKTLDGKVYSHVFGDDGTQRMFIHEGDSKTPTQSFFVYKQIQAARNAYEREFDDLPERVRRVVVSPLLPFVR